MSEHQQQDTQLEAVPFFARFLEHQSVEELSDEAMQAISGGKKKETVTTMKYPSDTEESLIVTMKYPSDTEESLDLAL
jgi:bacteriocin-like protein